MARKVVQGENDLETVNPTLALEWHPTKNGELTPSMVSANSHRVVYWLGKCGHTWPASIKNRNAQGRGCPYCSNQIVLAGFNDLASQYPDIVKQWDYKKNAIKPNEVIAGGNKHYYWICEKGHSWPATIGTRKKGRGCPYCSNKVLLVGFNDLATTHPDLAEEWDYDLNTKSPKEVMAGSNGFAHWKCKLGHTWSARIISRKRGTGCPYCAGQKVWPGFNDLMTKDPELAAEWDYEKNKITPSEVTVCSSRPFFWRCKFGHSWSATITNRHQGRGCPKCDENNKTSLPEQVIFFYVCRQYPDSVNRYKDLFENGMELDIYIPSLKTGIEYDGPYHLSDDALERDAKKYSICKAKGIQLIRVSLRNEKPKNLAVCDVLIHSDYDYRNYEALDDVMAAISNYVHLDGPFDTKNDLSKIKKGYLNSFSKNNLAETNPDLVREWNYLKNGDLTPEMFSSGSGEKVWWRCRLGHEWPAAIHSRVHGKGCPYCSGHRVLAGFNDLAHKRPELAAEWDYEKNEGKLPSEVAEFSTSSAWWICPKGHDSYRMTIADKSRGHGCRLCMAEKTGEQFSKQVLQFSIDGEYIKSYKSATEAGKELGMSTSAISKACRGENKTCAGYIFKYQN